MKEGLMKTRSGFANRPFGVLLIVMVWTLSFATGADAQRVSRAMETVNSGTVVNVRTNEEIDTSSDGKVFTGVVENDVIGRSGRVAIPRGSDVELVVKKTTENDLVLDLDSVSINGRRYSLTSQSDVTAERKEGIGVNKRTGKYVGGGAAIGAIIGAIAGGGKGAAIGAGVGAAGGAGAQVLTRGKEIEVPAESLLSFRLTQAVQTPVLDNGYYRNNRRTQIYGDSNLSAAYQAGLQAGRSDADRNLARNPRSNRWSTAADRRDYEAGYNRGYDSDVLDQSAQQRFKPSGGSVTIGDDNNIRWQGPANSRVFVQMDNQPRKLFASGQSGTQEAPWIETGHVYVFILVDNNGNEIARDRVDLRRR
jgi:hypothetical protein